jgi:low affinity Fe/Cu permease
MTWSFRQFAAKTSEVVGSSQTFLLALLIVLAWAALGPRYQWSEGHALFINTMTTIVTFLMVFLIQNTQNRDTKALHLKIDELLKATRGARNSMIDLERLSDEQLRHLEAEFKRICTGDPLSDVDSDGESRGLRADKRARKVQRETAR